MDKMTINLFLGCNKLVTDEVICHAMKKDVYNNEIDDYTTFYRVITVNTRTGEVKKYTHYGHITQGENWYVTNMH